MNRQIGVGDSKNVIVFDPLLTSHVIRRMRSGRVRIFSGNQWETLYLTRSSAIAEGPRDASCQLKSCQLPRNSAETTYTTSPDRIDGMKLEI